MADKTLKQIFTTEKPTQLLISLLQKNESYGQELARDINTTYSHTLKVLEEMKKWGLVQTEKQGRKKIISLTETGRKVAAATDYYCEVLEDVDHISSE